MRFEGATGFVPVTRDLWFAASTNQLKRQSRIVTVTTTVHHQRFWKRRVLRDMCAYSQVSRLMRAMYLTFA
jgi:hypothetical protein